MTDQSSYRHAFLVVACALALANVGSAAELEPIVRSEGNFRLGHAPPKIGPVEQTFLVRTVRRVLEHSVRDEPAYEPAHVPASLGSVRCRVSVTLRHSGGLTGTADSDVLPVVEACRSAALKALSLAERDVSLDDAALSRTSIEIELIGPRERVGNGDDTPQLLAVSYEPAVHGIAVRLESREILVRPSQLIARESVCLQRGEADHRCNRYEMTIARLQEKFGLAKSPPARKPAQVVFLRFRTTHLYEPTPGAKAVHLQAGMRVIQPDEVTRSTMLTQADDLARYIRYRQNTDGLFSYEFLPGRDMYWPTDQNWSRQAATTWALAVHANQRADADSAASLKRALNTWRASVTPIDGARRAAYIATEDNRHALGTTALVALALLDAPAELRDEAMLVPLLNGLAWMQKPDGSFRTHFPPAKGRSSQDYYPGEALLALAKRYVATRDVTWRDVCDRSLPFYIAYFRKGTPPAFMPWQMQAWGQMARTTRLQRYADFVYLMGDELAATQIIEPEPGLSFYAGGFDVYGSGRVGVSTAVYAEGMVDASRTAAAMGDTQRAAAYRDAVRRAARFVSQLRFREEECYYVKSRRDVGGGVRNSPSDPTLRIDHSQHALSALLGAAELMAPNDAK